MTALLDQVAALSTALDAREAVVRDYEARFAGNVPLSFVSAKAREELGANLLTLRNNVASLTVTLLAERLRLTGFTVNGEADLDLWRRFQRFEMDADSDTVHIDALALGCSYVSVWVDSDGQPVAVPEHASQMIHKTDPVTRAVTVALKRWQADGRGFAVLYTPDAVTTLQTNSHVPDGGAWSIGAIPSTGWTVTETLPNPLGVVPVVPFVNGARLTSPYGDSEMTPVADLQDALTKLSLDMLISSEAAARPRRWVTGIEIPTDDDGNPVDVWAGGNNTAMSEAPESRFGQFAATDLAAYETGTQLIVKQIAAISGLPAHALMIDSSQAISADAIRSAEAGLVAKAEARQKIFGKAWAQVARLLVSIRDGVPVRSVDAEALWGDPSSRSVAAEMDAATKAYQSGLLSREGTLTRLGLTPAEVDAEMLRGSAQAVVAQIASGAK